MCCFFYTDSLNVQFVVDRYLFGKIRALHYCIWCRFESQRWVVHYCVLHDWSIMMSNVKGPVIVYNVLERAFIKNAVAILS